MKTLPILLQAALFFVTASTYAGSLGPGPWSSGAYYPGGADGKYQAAAYGNNITGVIGFAIREGSPTVLQQQQQQQQQQSGTNASAATASFSAATAAAQAFDPAQNYFVIFAEGRTYSGLAVGSVNPVGKTVTGALLGAQPDFSLLTNSVPLTNTNTVVTVIPEQFPTFLTNTNVVNIGTSNQVVTNAATTNIFTTNTVSTNIVITNIGGVTFTNTVITTNFVTVTNIADPEVITNTVPIFQTNVVVNPGPTVTSNRLVTNTNVTTTASPFSTTTTPNLLPVLNRGLSGGFQAKLKNNQAYMTFRGDGELSTPAQQQTIDLATNAAGNSVSGTIETHTVSFKVDGLRTSFLTTLAPVAPTSGAGGNQ
jgi:hypothetical protein